MTDQGPTVPNPIFQIKNKESFTVSIGKRFEADVDRWFDILQKHDVDNVMTAEEFAQFEDLYSLKNGQQVRQQEMDDAELERLMILGLQLKERINLYKPLHVVDANGNQVLPTLPPIMSRLQSLHGAGNDAINIFHNAFSRDEQTPMGDLQQKKAAENLSRLIAMSQNQETIMERMAEFDEMAQEFHIKHLGKPVFNEANSKNLPPDPNDKPIAVTQKKAEDIDFFDFEDESSDE